MQKLNKCKFDSSILWRLNYIMEEVSKCVCPSNVETYENADD